MNETRYYFKKIHRQLEAGFNRACRRLGLTSSQFDILMYLSYEAAGKNTLTDIAAHLGVRHTSVIHVLKLLEKKELISKKTGGRSKPILLTARGKQLAGEIKRREPYLDEIMFAGLSEDELLSLTKMLKQIYANLDSDAFQNFNCSPAPEPQEKLQE